MSDANVTVVTAYYHIPSKFSRTTYLKWARNFLSNIPCNLVIFTSSELAPVLQEMRDVAGFQDKTCLIIKEFDQLYFAETLDHWKQQHMIDNEQRYHSPELYILWAEKIYFVIDAIKHNPFITDYFVWSDIGYFRNPKLLSRYQQFPKASLIPDDKMLYLQVQAFKPIDETIVKDIKGDFQGQARIGGGMFAGHRETIEKFFQIYLDMLERYKKAKRFSGKDQDVIASIYMERGDFFQLIPTQMLPGHDKWFYLAEYLACN